MARTKNTQPRRNHIAGQVQRKNFPKPKTGRGKGKHQQQAAALASEAIGHVMRIQQGRWEEEEEEEKEEEKEEAPARRKKKRVPRTRVQGAPRRVRAPRPRRVNPTNEEARDMFPSRDPRRPSRAKGDVLPSDCNATNAVWIPPASIAYRRKAHCRRRPPARPPRAPPPAAPPRAPPVGVGMARRTGGAPQQSE